MAAVYAGDLGELLDPAGRGDIFQATKTRDTLAATAVSPNLILSSNCALICGLAILILFHTHFI